MLMRVGKKGSSSSSQMFREPVSCHVAPTRQERPAVSQSGAMHFGLFLSSQTHSSLLVAVKGSSSSSTTKQRQHKTRLKKATAAGPIHIPTQHLPSVLNLIHSSAARNTWHLLLSPVRSLFVCVELLNRVPKMEKKRKRPPSVSSFPLFFFVGLLLMSFSFELN